MICRRCGKEIPDDSLFCELCGQPIETCPEEEFKQSESEARETAISPQAAAEEIKPVSEPKASKLPRKKVGGKTVVQIAVAAALIISIVGNIVLGMQLSGKAAELVELQAELADVSDKLEEKGKSLAKAQTNISDLETQIDNLEYKLKDAQKQINSLSTADDMFDDISDFAYSFKSKGYKQYSDIYTYSNAVIIKQGQVEEIYAVLTNSGTIRWSCDDVSVVRPQWSMKWTGSSTTLYVTGLKAGTAVLTITNSYNDHELKILVIVTD